jgi:6-phosphogluconolactonase
MNSIRVGLVILAIFAGATVNSFGGGLLVYFGTYTGTNSKGIYVSKFNPDTGNLTAPELAAETKNPVFLAVSPGGHFLYASTETTSDQGSVTGASSAFALENKTGRLTPLNQKNSGGIAAPCHVSVDATGKCLLVANYGSGSISVLPIHADGSLGDAMTMIQHTGSGVNPERQAGPHAHFILPSPDNRFALNCDLGLDKVFAYRLDANAAKLSPVNPQVTPIAPGSGPRHLTFSPDGRFIYVISEMASTVTAFAYDATNAAMIETQTVSTLPKDFSGNSTAAEIAVSPSGKFLYASNRGCDSIAVFAVDQKSGRLTFVENQSTQGRTPRHFAIDPSGRWLLAENQASDSVVVFAIDPDTGRLKPTGQTISVGSPVCAVFVDEK